MTLKETVKAFLLQRLSAFRRKDLLSEIPGKRELVQTQRPNPTNPLFEWDPVFSRIARLKLSVFEELCSENPQKKQDALQKLSGNEEALLAALDAFKRTSTSLPGTNSVHFITYYPKFNLVVYDLNVIQRGIANELAKMLDKLENHRSWVAVASYSKDENVIRAAEAKLAGKGLDPKTRFYRESSFSGVLDEGDYA